MREISKINAIFESTEKKSHRVKKQKKQINKEKKLRK
jgi:hypothetical protein